MIWMLIAGTASLLTALQLIPQALKAIKSKNLKGVSQTTFLIVSITAFLWMLYGIHLHDIPIIFANVITFICAFTITLVKLKE